MWHFFYFLFASWHSLSITWTHPFWSSFFSFFLYAPLLLIFLIHSFTFYPSAFFSSADADQDHYQQCIFSCLVHPLLSHATHTALRKSVYETSEKITPTQEMLQIDCVLLNDNHLLLAHSYTHLYALLHYVWVSLLFCVSVFACTLVHLFFSSLLSAPEARETMHSAVNISLAPLEQCVLFLCVSLALSYSLALGVHRQSVCWDALT